MIKSKEASIFKNNQKNPETAKISTKENYQCKDMEKI